MKIQQIRNATLKINYAGKIFLIAPWLVEKNKFGSFEDIPGKPFKTLDEVKNKIPAPICELPEPAEKILEGVDYYLITHIHPDHIDINFADGTVGSPLNKNVSVFAQDKNDAEIFKKSGFNDVKILSETSIQIGKIKLTKTPALHGKIEPMCAAEFLKFGRLIMDDEDVDCVHQTLPNTELFLTHLDNVPHASITRQKMCGLMQKRGIEKYFMPADGETVEF